MKILEFDKIAILSSHDNILKSIFIMKTSVMLDERVLGNVPIFALSVHSKIFNSRKDLEESITNTLVSPFMICVSNHWKDPFDLQSSS